MADAGPFQQRREAEQRARRGIDYDVGRGRDSLSRLYANIRERFVLLQVRTGPEGLGEGRRATASGHLFIDWQYSADRKVQSNENGEQADQCSVCSASVEGDGCDNNVTRRRQRNRHHKGRSVDPHRPSCSSQSSSDLSSPSETCYSFVKGFRKALQVSQNEAKPPDGSSHFSRFN